MPFEIHCLPCTGRSAAVKRFLELLGAVVVVGWLASCGGGGSSTSGTSSANSTARCGDFAYQEDAQAALRSGANQLDGDNDGIACESLPHRPSTPTQPTPPTSQPSAVGLWLGTSSSNRTFTGLVFPGGASYVFYSPASTPNAIAGFLQGTGTTLGSSLSSSDIRDFNSEGLGIASATLSASVQTGVSLNGSVGYTNGQTVTFTSAYDSRFTTTPTLSAVAGTYTGQTGTLAGLQSTVITVGSNGAVSSSSGGCAMTGTATARTDGNAYNVTVTFGPAPCLLPGQTLSGVSYFDAINKRLFAALLNSARTTGMVYMGTKP